MASGRLCLLQRRSSAGFRYTSNEATEKKARRLRHPAHPSSMQRREQSGLHQQALSGLTAVRQWIVPDFERGSAQIIRGAFATGDAYFRSGDLLRYDDQARAVLGTAERPPIPT